VLEHWGEKLIPGSRQMEGIATCACLCENILVGRRDREVSHLPQGERPVTSVGEVWKSNHPCNGAGQAWRNQKDPTCESGTSRPKGCGRMSRGFLHVGLSKSERVLLAVRNAVNQATGGIPGVGKARRRGGSGGLKNAVLEE